MIEEQINALGGVDYGDGQRLVCGAQGGYTGSTRACLLRAESAADDAVFVAAEIRQMVQAGTPVRDGKGGTRRARSAPKKPITAPNMHPVIARTIK